MNNIITNITNLQTMEAKLLNDLNTLTMNNTYDYVNQGNYDNCGNVLSPSPITNSTTSNCKTKCNNKHVISTKIGLVFFLINFTKSDYKILVLTESYIFQIFGSPYLRSLLINNLYISGVSFKTLALYILLTIRLTESNFSAFHNSDGPCI